MRDVAPSVRRGRPPRPFYGVEAVEAVEGHEFMADVTVVPLGSRAEKRAKTSALWNYPTPNGVFDPLTYLHVLDVLVSIDPDINLRAKRMVECLQKERDRFRWDPVTVGRVLSDLFEAFEEVLGPDNGLLQRKYDYLGYYYFVRRDEAVARVYRALHEDLRALSAVAINDYKHFADKKPLVSPLLECPRFRQMAADAPKSI